MCWVCLDAHDTLNADIERFNYYQKLPQELLNQQLGLYSLQQAANPGETGSNIGLDVGNVFGNFGNVGNSSGLDLGILGGLTGGGGGGLGDLFGGLFS